MNSYKIAKNIIKRLFKEFNIIIFLIIFPLLASVFAMSITGNGAAISIGIASNSNYDIEVLEAINSTEKYNATIMDKDEIEKAVVNKSIKAGIVLPKEINDYKTEKIQVISIRNDAELLDFTNVVQGIIVSVKSGVKYQNKELVDSINRQNHRKTRMSVGLLMMFILLFVGIGMTLLLDEKKMKTFMRIFCAPVKAYQVVLGNIIANFIMGTLQIVLFLLSSTLLFKTEWGTSVLNVFIILELFLIAALGFAIGLMGFIRSNQTFSAINSVIASMTCMLGGCFFPVDVLNDTIKKIANIFPQKWAMEAYDKLVSGEMLSGITLNLLILILFGAVFFTFGVKALKPTPQDI